MAGKFENIAVLITGANGFIGSHLTRKLISYGARVTAFIEPDTSLWRLEDLTAQIEVCYADITDYDNTAELIKKTRPAKIYHLAACVDVTRSIDLLDRMLDVNLRGTVNLLRALSNCSAGFDCFVNTGTCEEYGDNIVPFSENQRENPVSPYSASKVCTTYLCQMLYKTQQMPIVTIRPFLTYGPYQTNDMLIPSLIKKSLLNEEFEMTAGRQAREFNYVSDIVDGYVRASTCKKAVGQIINLGCGREYKVKDVADMIVKLTGSRTKPLIGKLPYREAETLHFYCSNQKAKELLDWQPRVSLLDGLSETIKWYRSYLSK